MEEEEVTVDSMPLLKAMLWFNEKSSLEMKHTVPTKLYETIRHKQITSLLKLSMTNNAINDNS